MKGLLTGNQLKIIALVLMTVDHVGMILFPGEIIFRIIGRLAMPVFAYMIAEGCYYTKNRKRYLGLMTGLALICQMVSYLAVHSLYQCILVTFSLSIMLIYLLDMALKKRNGLYFLFFFIVLMMVFVVTELIPRRFSESGFRIDYDFWGVLLPLLIYFARTRRGKLGMSAIGVTVLSLVFGGIQWYSLFALILLALYNGKRGKWNLKYLFYFYYPLHIALLHLIAMLITSV